jgi:hypothetical protein
VFVAVVTVVATVTATVVVSATLLLSRVGVGACSEQWGFTRSLGASVRVIFGGRIVATLVARAGCRDRDMSGFGRCGGAVGWLRGRLGACRTCYGFV